MGSPMLSRTLPSIARYVLWLWELVGLYVMLFVCLAVPFMLGSWSFNENVFLWRIFAASNASHHMVIVWTMAAFFVGAVRLGASKTMAIFSLLMVVSVHELYWWFTDWFFVGYTTIQHIYATPPVYVYELLNGYLFPLSLITIIFWMMLIRRFPWKFALWMGAFYIGWAAIGFPVTVNFGGIVPGYDTVFPNVIEWGSWAWGLLGFILFERDKLPEGLRFLTGVSSLNNNHTG